MKPSIPGRSRSRYAQIFSESVELAAVLVSDNF